MTDYPITPDGSFALMTELRLIITGLDEIAERHPEVKPARNQLASLAIQAQHAFSELTEGLRQGRALIDQIQASNN